MLPPLSPCLTCAGKASRQNEQVELVLAGRFVEALRSPLVHRLLQQAAAPLHHSDEGRAEDVAAYFGDVEQAATVLIAEQVQVPLLLPVLRSPSVQTSLLRECACH